MIQQPASPGKLYKDPTVSETRRNLEVMDNKSTSLQSFPH